MVSVYGKVNPNCTSLICMKVGTVCFPIIIMAMYKELHIVGKLCNSCSSRLNIICHMYINLCVCRS